MKEELEPAPFYNSKEPYLEDWEEPEMTVTWKLIVLGVVAILCITTVACVAVASGINGIIVKAAFIAIGAIAAGLGGYTFGLKRKHSKD